MKRELAAVSPHSLRWSASVVAVAAALSACGSGGGDAVPAAPVAAGTLRLALTDAPGCGFDHVFVTLAKIRFHQSSSATEADPGWTDVAIDPARRIDLLALNNGALQELGTTPLPPGHYTQMRLVLGTGAGANTVQPTGGTELPLALPGDGAGSLQVPVGFDIAAAQNADLVLDVDACKSVVPAGGPAAYQFKPAIAMIPRLDTAIQGTLAAALPPATTTVSAQQGGATIRATRPDKDGNFSIPYLQPGTYTVVVHSDARATGVVRAVPVGTGTTRVSTPASPITLPASTMAAITGAVSANTPSDTGASQDSALTDGELRASQSLSGGESIEVRSAPLDAVLGTYRLSVPKAAPVTAGYAASGALAFTPDASGGGAYALDLVMRDDAGPTN